MKMRQSQSQPTKSTGSSISLPKAFKELLPPARYKIYWGGRGSGKSWAFATALLLLGASTKPRRILCAREIQRSIRDSVHSLLVDRIKALGLHNFYQVQQNEIRGRNGTQIIFAGLWQNVDNIKSIEAIDYVWIEEANVVSENSWRTLIPSIRKEGSEIWASFNPALKSDPVFQRFVMNEPPNSVVKKVSWRDNPWVTRELKDEMEHLKEYDYEEYLHVYEGELKQFADGAIYAKQLKKARDEKRIDWLPTESAPVHTFWDLGRNDTTAIWFMQHIGMAYRFIDYYEHRLVDLDHYANVLREKGYVYGTHYLPHDAEHRVLGSNNRSRREILEGLGVSPSRIVPRIDSVENGIAMVRDKFSKCFFHAENCEVGLNALANYQYVWDERYDTFRQSPLHNWASNGADAFRMFAQGYEEEIESIDLDFSSEW
jgi:phage terminase large subunit